MDLSVAKLNDRGGRKYNEDYCFYRLVGDGGCFVLADGLGGHQGGATASKLTVETILDFYSYKPGTSATGMEQLFEKAAYTLQEEKNKTPGLRDMRTTVVLLIIDQAKAHWAHIGDSRLYRFRNNALADQTRDHSVPQMLADSGEIRAEEIRYHEDRNRLLRAFSGDSVEQVELNDKAVEIFKGDAFLLCSDGFWEYVLEPEMEEDLKKSNTAEQWLAFMERRLCGRVEPGHDNYSALAVIVQ